jgi:preprotein translocase subunit Sec63
VARAFFPSFFVRRAPERARSAGPVDLERLLTLARSSDYFSVLGLPRSASGAEVHERAAQLLFDLEAVRPAPGGGPRSDLQEVRQVVLDAREVLADDDLRAAYLKGIGDVADSTASE